MEDPLDYIEDMRRELAAFVDREERLEEYRALVDRYVTAWKAEILWEISRHVDA